jgi:SAM-dependent methyltransferase
MTGSDQDIRDHVRDRYAAAALSVVSGSSVSGSGASCCGPSDGPQTSCCGSSDALSAISDTDEGEIFGAALYTPGETDGLPEEAVLASLGCGNPLSVADLREGERVLDLGSGGGIDVLLSARRVGPTGFAYGLDMTDEMLTLARANAVKAGAANVEFVQGHIEDIPLPDGSIDVVISNCVINLSTDKPAVLAEMFRVLTPGGRLGISDVVAEDDLSPAERAKRGSYVGCIAGALSRTEYLDGLTAAGFTDPEVQFTHEAAPGMHGAIVRATKPAASADTAVEGTGAAVAGSGTRVVEVFEPALCCNTGVCGEDVDQALVTFSADVDWAVEHEGRVERHNLANDPLTFANNDTVKQFLQLSGSAGLPLVLVDGVTALTGSYPNRVQLARWAGITAPTEMTGRTERDGSAPTTIPAGVQTLGLSDAGACCSTDSSNTDSSTTGGCC